MCLCFISLRRHYPDQVLRVEGCLRPPLSLVHQAPRCNVVSTSILERLQVVNIIKVSVG